MRDEEDRDTLPPAPGCHRLEQGGGRNIRGTVECQWMEKDTGVPVDGERHCGASGCGAHEKPTPSTEIKLPLKIRAVYNIKHIICMLRLKFPAVFLLDVISN